MLRFWRQDAEDRAKHEQGQPAIDQEALRFASIILDPGCLWATSHRIGKIAARLQWQPEFGFHALPEAAWAERQLSPVTHSVDPIFDLTLVNDTIATSVLSAVGFEVHSVWTDLKGFPQAYKVSVTGGYVLTVGPLDPGVIQWIQLPDPIAVPAGTPVRYKLTLAGFRPNLRGNESLIRFVAMADGTVYRSRLINLGVY